MIKKHDRGFSLIELLVVITIIGIIATIVVANINIARGKANDAKRISNIREIQKALELSFHDNGAYPVSTWTCSYQSSWESGALGTALEPYLPTMPTDPAGDLTPSYNAGNSYCYFARNYPSGAQSGSGRWYMLVFTTEQRQADIDLIDGVTTCAGSVFDYGGDDGYILTKGGDCYNL